MKKRIVSLGILIVFAVCFWGCGIIQVKEDVIHDPATQEFLLVEAGYNATYWTLKNNPDYIAQVEAGLQGVEELLEVGELTEAVQIALNTVEMFKTINPTYLPLISSATRLLSLILEMDLENLKNYEQAKMLVKAFLSGAKAGIADVKFLENNLPTNP